MNTTFDTQEWARRHKAVVDGLRAGKRLSVIADELEIAEDTLRQWCRAWHVPNKKSQLAGYEALLRQQQYVPSPATLQAFEPLARQRGIPVDQFVERILSILIEEPRLISNVLDDGY